MKSFIKSTLGFKGKKKSESDLIPSKRNFKFDEISANTLIDLLDANVRKKTADKSRGGIQLNTSPIVGTMVDAFMEGTLTKDVFLKHDASTLWSVAMKILETCNPILTHENCSNLRNASPLQVTTITDALPLHQQQILGALFAAAEILIQSDDTCAEVVSSSLSNALLWPLTPDSSETSESFVNLVSNHRQNLPYCFTFSRKVGSAHDEIPSDKWTEILSRRTNTANSSAVPAVYLPVVDISSPQSKAGLYKDQPVQRSLQLNVVDQDGHTPSSSSAVKLAKLSGEVEEVSRSRKLSDSSIVLAGSSTAKSNDSWANAKSGGSSSTNTSQDKKRFVAAPEPASDSEEEDQKEDDSIVSLRDLQEVFASSLVSAASLEYLNVRELKEDDYADVKTLVRNVKWTLSHSELAAAVGDANKNVKESLKGILAWNDFLALADPYLHKTDRRFLKTNSVRYDQQYKRPDPAAAKKGTATTAAAASASGGAQSKSTSQKRSGNDSGSDSDESSDDKQRSVRTTGQKPAAEVKKGGRHNTDVSYEEETLDEIVMSNSPARTNKSKGGSSSSSGAGGRGRYSDHSDEEEEGGRRDFKRDNGVSQRNAAARAVLRSVVDPDDSDEDGQSIPDISETQPSGGGGRAEVSYGRNVSSSNNRGSAVALRLAPSSSRAAPLASSLVSDHSFDRESENSSDREGEDGDDIPTLDQEEDRRNQSQSQLNNSWDEESMRQDPHGRQSLDQSVEQDSNVMSLLRGDDKPEEEEEDEFGDVRPSNTANSAAAASTAMTKRRQPQVSMFSLTELDRSTTSFEGDGERGSERLQLDTSHTAAAAEEPNALLQSVNLNSPGQQSVGSLAFSNPQADTEGGQPGPKKKKGLMSKFKAALRLKGGKKRDGEGGAAAEEGGLGGRIRSMSTNSMNSVGTDEGSFDVSTHNNTAPGVQGGSPAVDEGKKKSMFSVLGFGRRPSAPSSPATNAAAAGGGTVPTDTTASAGIASTAAAAAPPHQSSITMRQEAEDRERRSRSSTPTIPDGPPAAAAAAAAAQQTTSAVVSSAPTSQGVAASMVPSVPDPSAVNPGAPSASAAAAATKPKSKWFAASSAATSKNQGGNTSNTAGSAAPSSSAAAAAADAPSIAELASSYSSAVASHSPAPHHGRVKRAHSSSEVLQTTNNSTAAAGGAAAAAPSELRHSSSVPTLEVNPASGGADPGNAVAPSGVSTSTNKLSNPAPKRTLSGIFSAPFRNKPTRSHSIDLGSPSGAAGTAAGASAEGSPAAAAPSPEANRRPSLFGSLLRRSNSNNSMTGGPSSAQGTPTGGLRKTPSSSQVSIRGNGLGLASLLRGPVSGSNAGSPAHPHGDSTPHSPSAAAAHHHKHHKKKHTLTVATEVTAVMKLQKALQKSKELHEYIESNSGTAMYHHKKTSTAAAVAADSTSGESKGKTNQFGFEIPTGGKPPKLDLLEEMKLIQRNAANHELRSFDAKLFQADDGFRSHHHTMEPDEEYLQEVHRAWDQIAKRREPLNMIVSAQDIELMKYLTKLFEKPSPPDPEVVAAHKVEARLRSTTSVLYPRFGEFVHSTHPVVPRASLVPDENLLKRQLSSHHSISTSTTNHSQIDLALAVKHGGQLLKCVSTRRGAFRKRYFTILVEPWVNPNLGGITPIIDAQNTTMATPPALQDDGGVSAAAAAVSGAEIDNMCDYYLQEYERSVTSKWGVLPLRLKQTYSLGKMISIVTDSSAAKKGREFSITFKLNKRINRSGVVSAQEVEANRLAAAAAEAEEEEDENGDGGSVSSGGGGSEVSGGDHSSDEEEESDKEEGEEEEEVAMDREELKRRKSKRGKSVRLAVDQAALPSTGTATGVKGNKKGEESKTDSTVNQITQLNSSEGDPGTAAASGDTAANAADVVLDHVDTKKQKKMKKKDRNIVTLRLRADTSDERLLWIKMLLAVGTSDVYVNTVRRCNRMNTSIGGTPFNVLLEQAASLKTAQLASSRTKYDSFDIWYQHSLYSRQDIIQIRNAGEFSEMIAFASDCKMLGNSLYEKLDYSSAIHQYERALSVFKWIEPLDPDWKNKGIDDETQRECTYQCKSDPELQLVKQLNLSCLLNLSICYLKSNEFKNCISACNAILALSPDNAKAYYRRAQAKLIPQSTGMVEHQEALKDMQMASSLQPNNASIKKEYLELRESLKAQVEKDKKTFNNLFDRVDYASAAADNTDGTVAPSSSSSSGSSSAQPAPALSYAEVLTSLKDLESAAVSYERDGNKQAAADARRRITAIQGLLEQAKKEQREQQQREKGKGVSEAVDYSEPSEKMVEEAAAQGIDLKDERVKKLMMEMERLRVQQQQANSSANKVDPNQLYREAMRGIHLDESKQLADKVLEGLTRNQLVDMLVSRSTFTFHANNTGGSSSGGGGSANVQAVVQSVSNVIGAYSPDKLYAELHDMIVQDVMSVKTRDDAEDNKEDNNERITGEIMSLLEVRYFNGGGGKRRKSGEKKPWWRTPSVIGIVAGLLFLIISVLLMPRSRSSVADGE